MIVFKTFLKILRKNIVVIVISTGMLLIFGGLNTVSDGNRMDFVDDKPDITIVDQDSSNGVTQGLINYLEEKSNLIEIPSVEDELKDALFYRQTNLIINIPENYNRDFMLGKNPEITFQSSGDYQAAFAEMIVANYLKTARIYRDSLVDAESKLTEAEMASLTEKLVTAVAEALKSDLKVSKTSHLDIGSGTRAANFFNFESYALLNSLIFIIAIVMLTFNEPKVYRRLLVSSTDPSAQSRILLFANFGLAAAMWLAYLLLGMLMLDTEIIFSMQGLWFIVNSLLFTFCATALAFLIGSLLHSKNAVNGVANVVALGSSFLCGAFVPQMWLPDSVLGFAHLLPTYYYINANNLIAKTEVWDVVALQEIGLNFGMIILFTIGFIGLTLLVPKIKQKRKSGA